MSDTLQRKPNQPVWAKPPYYTPPELPNHGEIDCGEPYGLRPLAEEMMRVNTAETLGHPHNFLYLDSYEGSLTPSEYVDSVISYAFGLRDYTWSKFTTVGFKPWMRGSYFASLIISRLKTIDASTLNNTMTGSVYDIWIANLKTIGKM